MEYEWSIHKVVKTIEDNCITAVELMCKIKNSTELTYILIKLPPKDDANFIDYNSLTADQVIQWCWDNARPNDKSDAENDLLDEYNAKNRNQVLDSEKPSWA
ncbi:hypothetical protein [Vibrio sp.]|uniref:DUF7936 family protein n=1 Tax=Vibrio sp. TaxID=678 RepID=UPI00311F31AC